LETLRDTTVRNKDGASGRLIDHVDVITGVSGGSFTALAYRLYGDKIFDVYEHDFLKRDIQGDLITGVFNPGNWGDLLSDGWGRSEMAANLYDQVLFKGATFGDLKKTKGPAVVVSTTDIQTGTRILFDTNDFNSLCTDLDQFRLCAHHIVTANDQQLCRQLWSAAAGMGCTLQRRTPGAASCAQNNAALS
jgi:NTE family protein